MSSVLDHKLQEALACFNARDLGGAERACGEILKRAPRHAGALHLLGMLRLMGGKAGEAVSLLNLAAETNPDDAAVLENAGLAHLVTGDHGKADAYFRRALGAGASHASLYMRLGLALGAQGRSAEAVSALRTAAGLSPADPDAHLNLGNALAEQGQREEALACYHKALALNPGHAQARFNLGNLFRYMGRLEEAEAAFRQALVTAPDDPDIHNNLGLICERQSRLRDAEARYRRALALDAGHLPARNNLGGVLRVQARVDEAIDCFEKVLSDAPNHIDAHINLGIARADQGRHAEAEALYANVLRLDPGNFEAHYNLGGLLKLQGRLAEAIVRYRRALEIDPKRAMAYGGLGAAHRLAGDLDSAIACFQKACELDPANAGTHYDLAETFKLEGRLDSAISSYQRTLTIDADHVSALGGLVHLRQHVCSWEGIEEQWKRMREKIAAGTEGRISPFSVISMPTSPAEQLECAKGWARRELASIAAARPGLGFDFSRRQKRGKPRIGYLSWGFHTHVTSYWAAELLELHDRGRFEVLGYGYGPNDGSEIRARIRSACDRFADLAGESYLAAAKSIYDDGVDVLVDLTGCTFGGRPQIAALRPAPVQVNWFYPGTMGTDCMDYFIADPFVVPSELEPFFVEKIVRLPHCYMVTDSRRVVNERTPTRGECGLPEKGFVFCCFNQAYKILPEMFDTWMRIMRSVPESVLWLAEANPWATDNLRRAAVTRGVAAERLVIARRKPLGDYLAQYRLVDLALDTFPYTSHTTAADALWAGCPLVTRAGGTFASRVAGSVLTCAGLRDLVTEDPADFERLAIELATSPGRLREIRRRVVEGRDSSPLFDTPRFVKNLEAAYENMFDAWIKSNSR